MTGGEKAQAENDAWTFGHVGVEDTTGGAVIVGNDTGASRPIGWSNAGDDITHAVRRG